MACAACSILLYYNTLPNDFIFDDGAAVVNNPNVRGESSFWDIFRNDFWATPLQEHLSHKSYRPITTLTFRITALLHGIQPMPFHFVNIVLNAVASYMAVQCIKCMTTSSTTTTTTSSWMVPVVTSLFYTFHPIHTEVVATIVGRADLLAAIFSFGAFLLHSQCIQQSLDVSSKPFLYCLGLAWLSALSKETGLMILGICGAHEVARIWLLSTNTTTTKSGNAMVYKSISRFVVLAITGLSYLLFRKIINGPSTGILPSSGDNPLVESKTPMQYALTAAFIMVLYVWRLINPFTLLCDYGYNVVPLVDGLLSDLRNVATLTLIITTVALGILAVKRATQKQDGRLLMALTWIFVPLLPASHILILGTVVAERLLFLPSLGYCMLVALAVEKTSQRMQLSQRNNTVSAMLVVVLALNTTRILSRNVEWSTEETLWKADYTSHPQNVKVAMSHASDLQNAGKYNEAWNILKNVEGLGDIQQFELCALQAKATALSQDDYEKAYGILDVCVQKMNARPTPSQKDQLVYAAYGYLLSQQERFEEAATWFAKASEAAELTGVNAVGSVCNEGEILARLGKWQESVPVLKKCAELSVRSREWNRSTKLMNLAKAYYMTLDFDLAEQVLVNDMEQTDETLSFLETVRKVKQQQEERAKAEKEGEENSSS